MGNSIWDTRFNNQSIAQDADDGEGQWITMHGAHIMIDDKGTIIAGANGKFNGKTVAEVKTEQKLKKWGREWHKRPDLLTNEELSKEQKKIGKRIKELENPEFGGSENGSNLKRLYGERITEIEREATYRRTRDEETQRIKKNAPADMSDKQLKKEIDKANKEDTRARKALWAAQRRDRDTGLNAGHRDHPKERATIDAWRARIAALEDEQEARRYRR